MSQGSSHFGLVGKDKFWSQVLLQAPEDYYKDQKGNLGKDGHADSHWSCGGLFERGRRPERGEGSARGSVAGLTTKSFSISASEKQQKATIRGRAFYGERWRESFLPPDSPDTDHFQFHLAQTTTRTTSTPSLRTPPSSTPPSSSFFLATNAPQFPCSAPRLPTKTASLRVSPIPIRTR